MATPKVYDQETYENYRVDFYDSDCEKEDKSTPWDDRHGDIFDEKHLLLINKTARENGYDSFEIVKTTEVIHRYAVEDESKNNEE